MTERGEEGRRGTLTTVTDWDCGNEIHVSDMVPEEDI